MKKKAFIKLLPMMFSLIICAAMLIGTTMAWLAMNQQVTSNGMQLQLEVAPNLVISDSTTEIVKSDISSINSGSPFAITQATNNTKYTPATHDADYVTYSTGLKYVTNPGQISPTTGYGTSLTFANAVNGGAGNFYIDYIVYVAAHSKEITETKLLVVIDSAMSGLPAAEVASGSLMATSIDVYKDSVSSSNYLGTTNVATKSPVYCVGTALTTGTIPQNTSSYLTFVLRCYFDGALESGTVGTAYINTATLDTNKVTLNVKFYIPAE